MKICFHCKQPINQFPKSLGQQMRKLRLSKGISQVEVANKLQVSDVLVSMWERGERRWTPASLAAYKEAIGEAP